MGDFYRSKLGNNLLIFYGVYFAVVLVLVIWNMVHWTTAWQTNHAGYEWSDDLIPIITWSGVAGIILVILAAIGLVLSQCAFFLILFFTLNYKEYSQHGWQ